MRAVLLPLLVLGSCHGVTVKTQQGDITGRDIGTGGGAFLGIPFGEIKERFAPAEPAGPFSTGTFDASEFGPLCLQAPTGVLQGDEKACLTVNVWIFGGDNVMGSSSYRIYDGEAFAKLNNVVVVSFNYRVGPWCLFASSLLRSRRGFLSFDGLPLTGAGASSFGLEDQRLALRWVQSNIAEFGGNPSSVALWGESSGGMAVCVHLLSPASASLFHYALIDSGNCVRNAFNPVRTLKAGRKLGGQVVKAAGCSGASDEVACMRNLTNEQLGNASESVGAQSLPSIVDLGNFYGPMIDGYNLVQAPNLLFSSGAIANQVPVLIGATSGAATLFQWFNSTLIPTSHQQLTVLFNATVETFLEGGLYDVNHTALARVLDVYLDMCSDNDPICLRGASGQLLSDAVFHCGTRDMAHSLARASPVFYWIFDFAPACFPFKPGCVSTPAWLGAYHASEITFAFNTTLLPTNDPAVAEASVAIQQRMVAAWGRMVRCGAPDHILSLAPHPTNVPWPPLSTRLTAAAPYFNITADPSGLGVRYGYKEEVCELWRDAFPDGTPPPTPSPVEVGHGSNKLSTGYIVLIVVSCLTPLEALLAYRYYKKRSKKQDDAAYHAMR